jgi:hypothetical protein
MNCADDGILRAHLDGELEGSELADARQHLATCSDCNARSKKLSAEKASTGDLLATLTPKGNEPAMDPAIAYAQFRNQFATADEPESSWTKRLFAPRLRPAWGLAAGAVVVAMLVGVTPVRTWAQRVLALLRVEKIAIVTIDPSTLINGGDADAHPYKLIDQFIADNVVVTAEPSKPEVVGDMAQASRLAGYPVRTIGSLGTPQAIEVSGETRFHMTLNRGRIETLLEEVGRSDIHIPKSADGALITVEIPKIVVTTYGDCPARTSSTTSHSESHAEAMAHRKMERMASGKENNCTYLIQAASPTVSVPPNLNMSQIAEAALELAGMNSTDARALCQTIDWSSTLVVPIPRNAGTSQTVTVDGVPGTLITETLTAGNRYSLLWIRSGVIHSLSGRGNSSDALKLAASLE